MQMFLGTGIAFLFCRLVGNQSYSVKKSNSFHSFLFCLSRRMQQSNHFLSLAAALPQDNRPRHQPLANKLSTDLATGRGRGDPRVRGVLPHLIQFASEILRMVGRMYVKADPVNMFNINTKFIHFIVSAYLCNKALSLSHISQIMMLTQTGYNLCF